MQSCKHKPDRYTNMSGMGTANACILLGSPRHIAKFFHPKHLADGACSASKIHRHKNLCQLIHSFHDLAMRPGFLQAEQLMTEATPYLPTCRKLLCWSNFSRTLRISPRISVTIRSTIF